MGQRLSRVAQGIARPLVVAFDSTFVVPVDGKVVVIEAAYAEVCGKSRGLHGRKDVRRLASP